MPLKIKMNESKNSNQQKLSSLAAFANNMAKLSQKLPKFVEDIESTYSCKVGLFLNNASSSECVGVFSAQVILGMTNETTRNGKGCLYVDIRDDSVCIQLTGKGLPKGYATLSLDDLTVKELGVFLDKILGKF